MTLTPTWTLNSKEAVQIQQNLRSQIQIEPFLGEIKYIAGTDISFNKFSEIIYAGIVVLKYPEMQIVEEATVITSTKFPYISGLLSFREIPALLEVWGKLQIKPDIIVADGQGIAHPRRLGIASHFGLLVDKPTLGCAKSVLVGKYTEPALEAGSFTDLVDKNEVVGYALRTKFKTNSVFVSVGHKLSLEQAKNILLNCSKGYRIPEPTRQAHLLVNRVRIANPPIDQLTTRSPNQQNYIL